MQVCYIMELSGTKSTEREGDTMVKFYDPKDDADLARIEALLHKGGVEYSLAASPPQSGFSLQIEVAEEDVPTAEELLQSVAKR